MTIGKVEQVLAALWFCCHVKLTLVFVWIVDGVDSYEHLIICAISVEHQEAAIFNLPSNLQAAMEDEDNLNAPPKTAGTSPELKASFLSTWSWHWLQSFVSLGNAKTIEAEDLYDMNPKERTQYCEQLWNDAIETVRRTSNENAPLSVWRLLWLCFGFEYALAAIFKPVWLIGVILQVYILKALVKVVEDEHNFKWWWGSLLVLGMFSMSVLVSISQHMCLTLSQKVGMKLRSTMSMAVFNKLLSIKLFSLVGTNSGFLLNLVTNDSQKLLDTATFFNFVWFALIELGTVSTLAIIEIGVSAVPGVILSFLTQPLQVWMAHVGARLRIKAVKYTDSRVHLTEEILNGIRVIKYNGWIAPFLHRIEELRHHEINRIRRASFVRASTSAIRDSVTPLASLATFGTYLAIHKGTFMSPSQAFTVLALFSVLVRTFSIASVGFQTCGDAVIAVRRLQQLINMDKDDHIILEENEISRNFPEKAVMLKNCSFCWEQRQKKVLSNKDSGKVHIEVEKDIGTDAHDLKLDDYPSRRDQFEADVVLRNVNFSVGKGELVSIYGPVGSGKSSLFLAILGEMQCLTGSTFVQDNIAYVPQQPWILNDTVRQNIVFTSPFDPERYQRVIAACALEHDILLFAGGHDTEIGDKGINLSGGQKARISLARACYSAAPIVFLDDPLAAVDVPTAKHLIGHVLNGVLKGRTVVLVTHNKTALEVCDRVYFMENGSLHEDKELKRVNTSADPSDQIEETDVDALIHVGVNENSEAAEKILIKKSEPLNFTKNKEKGRSTVKEDRVMGNIQASTLIAYAKASGGLPFVFFVTIVFLFGQVVRVMVDYWLRVWTDQKYQLRENIYIAVYSSFVIGATILSLSRALLYMLAAISAATRMHGQMAERVLRSPQLFFDQNITGRILNRFSKDQALVDETLPTTAQQFFEYSVSSLGSLIFIGVLIPWFLLAFPPFLFVFFYLQRRYVVISRELKRLEGISRSPIYAHFTQTLQGITSVRAYGTQTIMHNIFNSLIDENHRSYILFVHMSRWIGIRLDFATCMCVTLASLLIVVLRHSITAGLAGVVIVQSMQVTGFIQFAVRQAAEVENYLTSVERINAYANLATEAEPHTAPGIIEENWPSRGEIEFVKYTMTYRVDLPPVLNEVSFKINAKEKIGILGRTGVGKSSLAAALFRMVENERCGGDILIDGVNIKFVGLDDLRQRLSIIPQDPILFQGSVRFNLDPFELYEDAEIYEALERVHLIAKILSLDRGLDSLIAQNGENFSVGQRQLICLARSLLRRSQIIVMDEATAAVDGETDTLIQRTIRTTFQDCTMLTIAHRIDTIIDCERVLILAAGGQVAEFDSPHNLLNSNNQGIFAEMVRQAGPIIAERLHKAAYDAESHRLREQQCIIE
ncbi:hypothetical protein GOP47_0018704 [Adiantum capillus-veneris]|uniref:Uncharacterized protein n=1 Tax=Adiantum capillus-veneris TaxID=13818 RepID=A0A9D4UDX1_ADICA|nr:hypothetical protein GOP47_0018704 [Adiantum capillus-veneris]